VPGRTLLLLWSDVLDLEPQKLFEVILAEYDVLVLLQSILDPKLEY